MPHDSFRRTVVRRSSDSGRTLEPCRRSGTWYGRPRKVMSTRSLALRAVARRLSPSRRKRGLPSRTKSRRSPRLDRRISNEYSSNCRQHRTFEIAEGGCTLLLELARAAVRSGVRHAYERPFARIGARLKGEDDPTRFWQWPSSWRDDLERDRGRAHTSSLSGVWRRWRTRKALR